MIVVIAVSLAILLPILNSRREAQRRATCLNNQKQIALAFKTYASTFSNAFPPSAQAVRAPDGTKTVGGFSFLVKLLSFLDDDSINPINTQRSVPMHLPSTDLECLSDKKNASKEAVPFRESVTDRAIVDLINKQPAAFLCPSSPRGAAWRASAAQGITSYKALGATSRDSLVMAANPQAAPPYGTAAIHPDGTIYPAGHNLPIAAVGDGLSHTIITVETLDEAASRWVFGKETTLVGLPQSSSATGTAPQPPLTYFAPPGFDGTFGPGSAVAKAGLRTFLSYDFSPGGADAGKYEDPGFGKTPPAYGPSSGHPAVVIGGMGDGSARPLSKQIDAAARFFLITKNNSDPFYTP